MLRRLWQAILSFLGLGPQVPDDPEAILRQYMADIRARVPKINQAIVEMLKTEVLLRGQVTQLEAKTVRLETQVIAAVKLGPAYEGEAKALIAAMQEAKESLEATREQCEAAGQAVQQTKAMLNDYLSTMDSKCRDAMRTIEANRQARIQEELVSVLSSLPQGYPIDTLDRAKEKVARRAALAQARLDLETGRIGDPLSDLRRNTTMVDVEQKLLEYKRQLGMNKD